MEQVPDLLNLKDVLVATQQSDAEIRILSLERYEDGFIVRHATPSGPRTPESSERLVKGLEAHAVDAAGEAALNPMGLTSLTVSDDVGTDYRLVGMNAGTVHGMTMFQPAIPAHATRLEVLTKAGFVPFELQPPK